MSDPIQELLPLYVTGDLDADERVRVEAWLARSPENRRALAEVEAVVRRLAGAAFDTPDRAVTEIDAGAIIAHASAPLPARRLRTWMLSAAAVLIAFFAGMWVQRSLNEADVQRKTVEEPPSSQPSKRARDAWRIAQRGRSGFASSLAGLKALTPDR